ncbi:interleukin-10 receptor subunit alpha [Brachyistius frenatus]|uniref:interleukin-10 receptor subunit alpha n=1 Tax=Brachyistius frenatus TaxID=100188 RepID=UPI0037E9393D
MTTSLLMQEMDIKNNMPILVFLIIYMNRVSGVDIPQPEKLIVDIMDGEVVVLWQHPVDAPSDIQYNVQMAKYTGEWDFVASCTGITNTYCDLSSLIHDYTIGYKVRIQLVAGDDVSMWTAKKILPNTSKLHPPSFTLVATSSTLTVYVHQKNILEKLFPYGLTYTIYLEEKGKDTNITAYLKVGVGEDKRTTTFTSLHWGREYCVSLKGEGTGTLSTSSVSPKQCLQLPEQEWFIIAVSSLSILGVLAIIAIMATILLCYVKFPEKTPAALKSPVSGWLPLSVGEGTIEVVTDKGWFLSGYKTEMKTSVKDPVTLVTVIQDNDEEDRRTSMDSGVNMESNSATSNGGSPPVRQEDSGCGSMGGPESSTSSQTDYPLQDERTDTVRKRQDSGVGLGCRLDSSSIKLDGQDSGPLKEFVSGGNYRSQRPSAVQIHVCDDEDDTFKQILPNSILAEVVTGYKAGPQSCICSGAGQCPWCHKHSHYESEIIKQYRAVYIENRRLGSKCDLVDSNKGELTFSGCTGKTQMDTVRMNDFETACLHIGESFPLLTSLTPLPPVKCEQDFNMNNLSLSLCDVQLKTD